ncbi:MAG: type IX secretion system membrane protein PorP/SprF, partial [Sphingobacteriales bacterium]
YYANPLWLNPALTGVIDGNYRLTANFKQQWANVSNAYITGGASFDMAPKKNLALGVTVLTQKAGELNFNYLTALASASYRIAFGQEGLHFLSFGLQAGIIHRSFSTADARFGNQYNPLTGYDPNIGSNESYDNRSALVPDINFGMMYFDGHQNKTVNPFLGASVAHLNRPVERFLGVEVKTPMRFIAHGGARVKLNETIDLTPNALLMYQGNAREYSFGAYAQMWMNPSSTLLFGGNYRMEDAGIAFVGIQYKNMVFGLSYDINTSRLSNATRNNGGLELSVSLIGRNGIIAPNFFCPRL